MFNRFKRQGQLEGQLMSQDLVTTKNYAQQLSACLDWRDYLMIEKDQAGSWFTWIMRVMCCLLGMILGSKISFCICYDHREYSLMWEILWHLTCT